LLSNTLAILCLPIVLLSNPTLHASQQAFDQYQLPQLRQIKVFHSLMMGSQVLYDVDWDTRV